MIWLNGRETGSLPLPDRGLELGDGLFETLLLRRGRPLLLEYHLARLGHGLEVLGFPDCGELALRYLRESLAQAAEHCGEWNSLRLTVTRGAGPRGYAPPAEVAPRFLVALHPLSHDPRVPAPPARAGVATMRWSCQPALAGIKHLNRLEQVMAAREARAAGWDEALMLDQEGAAVSLTAGNLFLVRGTELITPELAGAGIAGTRRQGLIERWAPAAGYQVRERRVDLEQVQRAEEVFYSNSLYGMRPLAALGEGRWRAHPVCAALHQHYLEDVL